MPNDHITAELVQRTWAAVWDACQAGRYDPNRSAITTFVYAVATNITLQHLRDHMRQQERTEALRNLDPRPGGIDPADTARMAEALHAIRSVLAGDTPQPPRGKNTEPPGEPLNDPLSDQERWLLRAAADGLSDRELAQRLRVSPSTAHTARKQALVKLKRILAMLGIRADSAERTPPDSEELHDR